MLGLGVLMLRAGKYCLTDQAVMLTGHFSMMKVSVELLPTICVNTQMQTFSYNTVIMFSIS